MHYKFFAIPATHSEWLEADFNAFCLAHRVVSVEKHFVMDGQHSYWAVCVCWLEGSASLTRSENHSAQPAIDYKKILNAADFAIYLELRNFGKQLAELQNVPPYALFTNDQLASMVQQRVSNNTQLAQIPGVGKARIEKYGQHFLTKLAAIWADQPKTGIDETGTDHP
ncbi:HRDC domain-containing protein [Methylomonas sp. HYX-M1]|uniref:HRDC domain-containing protein n=1 Tax=Methylomonas sp. HYX-M1 TaxID=3139307 RepID=UPI00345B9747